MEIWDVNLGFCPCIFLGKWKSLDFLQPCTLSMEMSCLKPSNRRNMTCVLLRVLFLGLLKHTKQMEI